MQRYWFTALSIVSVTVIVGVAALTAPSVFAYRSGCHNLHTCPSDTDTYVCGDLGYACRGATSLADIPAVDISVPIQPLVVVTQINALFRAVYDGRNPTVSENQYWAMRLKDKPTSNVLQGAMAWHRAHGIAH